MCIRDRYDGETPILEAYEIEDEIEKALRSKVWLSCGGYIVFDETEALTSIDAVSYTHLF